MNARVAHLCTSLVFAWLLTAPWLIACTDDSTPNADAGSSSESSGPETTDSESPSTSDDGMDTRTEESSTTDAPTDTDEPTDTDDDTGTEETGEDSEGEPWPPPDEPVNSCEDASDVPAPGFDGPFTDFRVNPFLQLNESDSVWVVWEVETNADVEGRVEWGCTDALPNVIVAERREGKAGTWIFEAQISGLDPHTEYGYRVEVDGQYSEPREFHTLTETSAEANQRFMVMADMQPGNQAALSKWIEVASEGVVDFLLGIDREVADLSGVIIPGDMVSNGNDYDQWANLFFPGAEAFAGSAALWPVPGNHEYQGADTHFFSYFMLPDNGGPGAQEHWYTKDFGNVRLVGLDSNGSWAGDAQLDWLQAILDASCDDEAIDFVFAQLHHPHRSELWLPGEKGWSGQVVARLEDFTTSCDKPSIHFFGHTHAYNRGSSRDAAHVWMNVATAAGNIDYFGEFPNADYTELNVAYDDYGFVYVESWAGDSPGFRLRRYSRGDEFEALDNELRDEVVVRRYNQPPATPQPPAELAAVNPACAQLPAGAFSDPDGDEFGANRVQVAATCEAFAELEPVLLVDQWWQAFNIWDDVDTNANLDPEAPLVSAALEPETDYCYRVKVRDAALAWSAWSEPRAFTTAAGNPNLLGNGGAEAGIDGWSGDIESVASGECSAGNAQVGARFFAVGGVCEGEQDYGVATQVVALEGLAGAIDGGELSFELRGYLRDFNGSDEPAMHFELLDQDDAVLATSATVSHLGGTWTQQQVSLAAPVGTRKARVILEGTRNAGSDNDSYFDALSFRVVDDELAPCPEVKALVSGL